jgi:hypothetical protein
MINLANLLGKVISRIVFLGIDYVSERLSANIIIGHDLKHTANDEKCNYTISENSNKIFS